MPAAPVCQRWQPWWLRGPVRPSRSTTHHAGFKYSADASRQCVRRCASKWNGLLRGRPRSGSVELPGESLWKELEDGGEQRGSGRVRNMKKVVRRNCCYVCVSARRGRLVITTAWRPGVENSRVRRPVSPGETEKEQRCTDGLIGWCFLWTANGSGERSCASSKKNGWEKNQQCKNTPNIRKYYIALNNKQEWSVLNI